MVISLSVIRNTLGRPGKQVGASSRIGSSQDEDLLGLHRGGQAWSQVGAEDGPEAEQGALEPALLLLLLQLRPQGNLPACPGGSTYFHILSQALSQDSASFWHYALITLYLIYDPVIMVRLQLSRLAPLSMDPWPG